MPPSLQDLLSGSPKDLIDGKGGTGTLGLGWICSFSIPIITICAFIVLNIFLSLFDLCLRLDVVHQDLHSVPEANDGE